MKKAQSVQITFLNFIVPLIIILALVVMVQKYTQSHEEISRDARCKLSIGLKTEYLNKISTAAGKAGKLVLSNPGINCEAHVETLIGDDSLNIKSRIAEHLRECWYKTNGNNNKIGYQTQGIGTGTFCILCSRITTSTTLPSIQLKQYLRSTTPPNHKQTYTQILSTTWGTEALYHLFINPQQQETLPFPNENPAPDLVTINKETSYDIIAINRLQEKFESHLVFLPTTKIPLLACTEFHQQLPDQKTPEPLA
ncbi:MAG: hypothetical protein AABX52_03520 [Nanoarchaeota archaeon]